MERRLFICCSMTGNIQSGCAVWLGLLVLVLCRTLTITNAAPFCTNDQPGCHTLYLDNLFDRVVQHSARVHSISNDLHSDFEHYFLRSRNQIDRVGRNCHTSTILTPNGKENAQQMAREELTEVILRLLVAWKDPLWRFHQSVAQHRDLNDFSSDRALELSHMVHQLHNGVERVAEKMQLLGILSDSIDSQASPETTFPSDSMRDYDLLFCFRRDSNKIQNYLKILKCRVFPEHKC